MNEILIKQFCADYCCSKKQVKDDKNHFTIYSKKKDRRKYKEEEDCFLKILSTGKKLLFCGREDIIAVLKEKCSSSSGEWFFEGSTIGGLERLINKYGYTIDQLQPYYIAENKTDINTKGYEIQKYEREDIEQFREDERFEEAFVFEDDTPDMLGYGLISNGEIIGMAGASADSPYMWQIGVNVTEGYEGKGIGSTLVTTLKNDILDRGYLPYYGTSFSHIASQKVALKSGFMLAWIELSTTKIE